MNSTRAVDVSTQAVAAPSASCAKAVVEALAAASATAVRIFFFVFTGFPPYGRRHSRRVISDLHQHSSMCTGIGQSLSRTPIKVARNGANGSDSPGKKPLVRALMSLRTLGFVQGRLERLAELALAALAAVASCVVGV